MFLGTTITDRTNRITLIKIVAQILEIEEVGYIEFYKLEGNIILRKGTKEYKPNNKEPGFYMGTSTIDKDNRITIIELVTKHLQIKRGQRIDFFLTDKEIMIKQRNHDEK